MEKFGDYLLINPFNQSWAEFINTKKEANIFHHPQWTKFLNECYGFKPFIVTSQFTGNNIGAGLPMMETNHPFKGRRWVSLPFSDHCNPLFNDGLSLDRLNETLQFLFQSRKSPLIELRWKIPGCSIGQPSARYAFHQIPLSSNFNSAADNIHPMHRRNSRTALKKGVQVVWGSTPDHLHEFYQLHLQTRKRQGVPIQPKRFFELLHKEIIAQGLGAILLAFKDGQCLAGAVFLHWQSTFTYKFGASNIASLSLRPNDLIFCTAIQWACEHGFTVFDLGRSDLDNPSLCSFKRGWGAEETTLTYRCLSRRPQKTIPGSLFKIMKPVIRNSPGWVCKLAGELFYKYSG